MQKSLQGCACEARKRGRHCEHLWISPSDPTCKQPFQYVPIPKRTYTPSPKLPGPRQVKCLRRDQHSFSHLMLLKSVVFVEVALLVLLGPLEMIFGLLDKLLNVLYEVNSSRPPTLMPSNCINMQANLFPINKLKRWAPYTLSNCWVDCKLNITQEVTPLSFR